jgi:small subunit ribosomal protein S6
LSQTQYETTIVIDSLQKSEDMQNMVTKIENFIKNNGGTITDIEEWGKKRLAYEINRKQYGTYFHILFEGPSTLPALLEAEYRLQEPILRFLTVQSDPRVLKRRAKEAQEKSEAAKETKPVEKEPATEVKTEKPEEPAEPEQTAEAAEVVEPAASADAAEADDKAEDDKKKEETPAQE